MDSEITKVLTTFRKGLTLDGKKKVFEDKSKLTSEFLVEKSDPEAFTREFLIDPVFKKFKLHKIPEKHFKGVRTERKVDYYLKNKKNMPFLAEAKPLNTDLFEKGEQGAVNQIKGLFRLAEVKENYEFGIATDGLQWVFIDKNQNIVYELEILKDLPKIKELLMGKSPVSSERVEEEISKKFYDWYDALLHGGKYKDHENKLKSISHKDCLIENIVYVSKVEDREHIAQVIMDRLIFIKFLQSKEIISSDILHYLIGLKEDILNEKLKQLFFQVLNAQESERFNIDPKFQEIPYLNGSLFLRTEIEKRNLDYKIRAFILREVIEFLDSFKFVYTETASYQKVLDPKILGYIFERAMTATDRKGTGTYYTPRPITRYISENTIYPLILKKVNSLLKERGYKDSELLSDIEQVYRLREKNLADVFDFILNLRICDNACGSGAFLLAVAEVLLDVYQRINNELRLKNPEVTLRKLILKNNLYGVDINPNAIEIARLRLWLWLVSVYEPTKVEPLPNIDYNIRVGNSLLGFIDITKFREHKLSLLDYLDADKSVNMLLTRLDSAKLEYKGAIGKRAQELRDEIEETTTKIKTVLDAKFWEGVSKKTKISKEEFLDLNVFHWGHEFHEIFKEKDKERNGFDVVIGNPPYSKILKDNIVKKTEEYDEIKSGMMNLAAVFINRSLNLINQEAHVGMIVPKMLAFTSSWNKVRHKLLSEATIERVMDCGKAFKGVLLEQIIFILDKTPPSALAQQEITIGELKDTEVIETARVNQKLCLDDDSIYLEPNPEAYLIKSLMETSRIKLGDIADITLGLGIQGKKDVFVDKPKDASEKALRGNDIQRYYIRGSKFYNPASEELKPLKDQIAKFKVPHIVAQRIVAHIRDHIKITAALDSEGLLSFNTVTNIFVKENNFDVKYILAILNSNAVQYYTYKFIYKNAIRSMDFYKSYAEKIPIPKVSKKNQEDIINLVDKLIELSQTLIHESPVPKEMEKEITTLEDTLNSIIYSHYGLNENQWELIEESLV